MITPNGLSSAGIVECIEHMAFVCAPASLGPVGSECEGEVVDPDMLGLGME